MANFTPVTRALAAPMVESHNSIYVLLGVPDYRVLSEDMLMDRKNGSRDLKPRIRIRDHIGSHVRTGYFDESCA